jgi:hypothetical protein
MQTAISLIPRCLHNAKWFSAACEAAEEKLELFGNIGESNSWPKDLKKITNVRVIAKTYSALFATLQNKYDSDKLILQ